MRFLFQLIIVLVLPVFLVLTSMRLMMTSAFARWEYAKPNFPTPAEVAGDVTDDVMVVPLPFRQEIVDTTLAYVKGAGTESMIAEDLTFENGRRVYNDREVRHLTDVRVLTGQAFTVHLVTGILLLLTVGYLGWSGRSQSAAAALAAGSGLTIGLIGLIGVIAAVAFRFFFVRFHRIFFEGDTWMFPTTDTLIQKFPEKFWFDVSLLIVLLTLVEAVVIGVLSMAWIALRRRQSRYQPAPARSLR